MADTGHVWAAWLIAWSDIRISFLGFFSWVPGRGGDFPALPKVITQTKLIYIFVQKSNADMVSVTSLQWIELFYTSPHFPASLFFFFFCWIFISFVNARDSTAHLILQQLSRIWEKTENNFSLLCGKIIVSFFSSLKWSFLQLNSSYPPPPLTLPNTFYDGGRGGGGGGLTGRGSKPFILWEREEHFSFEEVRLMELDHSPWPVFLQSFTVLVQFPRVTGYE